MDRQRWLEGTLYSPDFEQDSCGFGLIAQLDDKPSHWLVNTAISSLAKLTHRGAVAADGKSGDGCGLLFRKPDGFLREVAAKGNNRWTKLKPAAPSRQCTPPAWCLRTRKRASAAATG